MFIRRGPERIMEHSSSQINEISRLQWCCKENNVSTISCSAYYIDGVKPTGICISQSCVWAYISM